MCMLDPSKSLWTSTISWESLNCIVPLSNAIAFRDDLPSKNDEMPRNVASWWALIGIDLWALTSLDILKEGFGWRLNSQNTGWWILYHFQRVFWKFCMFFSFHILGLRSLSCADAPMISFVSCLFKWFLKRSGQNESKEHAFRKFGVICRRAGGRLKPTRSMSNSR